MIKILIDVILEKGVTDYDDNIITVDWRASISLLYYDSNIGECEYLALEGIIKGNLLLKIQYTIENSKLINFNDVDTVSNDELLNLDKAIPVIRHGEKVEYTNKDVLELVGDLKNKYKTVALITKTQGDSNILYDKLEINLINSNNLNYDSNINILPSYLKD